MIGEVRGCRVLLARAEKARDVLPKTLQARGAAVTIATLYRTLQPRSIPADIRKRLIDGGMDAVTFTSSSTVDGFMGHFSAPERHRIFRHARAAVIGPITAATLRRYGIRPAILAKEYTIEALAKAIVRYFSK